jgi:hypothetical protein
MVNLRSGRPPESDETSKFLLQQFFIMDAFACTTSFAPFDDHEIMTEDSGTVFMEFLKLIRRVTILERQAAARKQPHLITDIPPAELRSLFEQARKSTLLLSEDYPFATPSEHEQFVSVVESFHQAGLLYSYRCLQYPGEEIEISKTKLALFQTLDLLPSDHSLFAQDVMWPLFIAGTEARSEDRTRHLVEHKLQQAMKRTGFANCEEALAFLRALWKARDGDQSILNESKDRKAHQMKGNDLNWIHCAREWANRGNQFFVY